METFTFEHDGKIITYTSETIFTVETGKGSKGAYTTSYQFKGELRKAVFYFNCINIGLGYKKRLCMDGKTLTKQKS